MSGGDLLNFFARSSAPAPASSTSASASASASACAPAQVPAPAPPREPEPGLAPAPAPAATAGGGIEFGILPTGMRGMTVNEALMSEAAQQGVESTSNMIECEDVDGNGEGVMAGVLAAVQQRLALEIKLKKKSKKGAWLLDMLDDGNFWIRAERAQALRRRLDLPQVEDQYLKDIKVWLPHLQWKECMPNCPNGCEAGGVVFPQLCGTRRVVGLKNNYWLIGCTSTHCQCLWRGRAGRWWRCRAGPLGAATCASPGACPATQEKEGAPKRHCSTAPLQALCAVQGQQGCPVQRQKWPHWWRQWVPVLHRAWRAFEMTSKIPSPATAPTGSATAPTGYR